ncbi:MAG: DUF177 domain-containing protein [Candidatus Marinimicrobia bacterium]|nr:DUF177 domain-containing protein [Candidatus Neomarinimicrobiota bacterium]
MKILLGELQDSVSPLTKRTTLGDLSIEEFGDKQTPVTISIEVHPRGDDFELSGRIRARLETVCDRCLATAKAAVDAEFNFWLLTEERPDLSPGEVEYLLIPNTREIDISAPLAESLRLEIPSKVLCREDCRGLCPRCGTDLNHKQCTCDAEKIDERWSQLSDLKKRMESE